MTRGKWIGLAVAALLAWSGYQYSRGVRLGLYSVGPMGQERTPLSFEGESWRVPPAGSGAAVASSPEGEAGRGAAAPPVRNVILIVGDGMGFNQIAAARAELVGPNGRLFMETLPVATWVTTHTANDLYTDSASSASALATGFKTAEKMVSQSLDGTPRRTLAQALLAAGGRVGLVTSTVIVDATPAAFLAHAADRYDWPTIAEQMAASGAELLVSESYEPKSEKWKEIVAQVLEAFVEAGFEHVTSWEALQAAATEPGGRTLALLPQESIARERSPSLAQIAELALHRLGGGDEGFFLLVEDEETDSGGHDNDLDRVVAAVADLDEVTRRAVEFARADGETLVLVTADHETGGLLVYEGAAGETMRYRYSSDQHTNGPVPLLAYGPGAERFSGVLDNTDVARLVSALTGWRLGEA